MSEEISKDNNQEKPLPNGKKRQVAKSRPRLKKDNPYYVGTKELREEVQKYFDSGTCQEDRVISEELGKMLIKIATRYATKPCFNGYWYKDSFIADAIYQMVRKLDKINLNHPRCNVFSYLTCICYCIYIAAIKKHNKQALQLKALRERVYEDFRMSENLSMRKELDELLTEGSIDQDTYNEIKGLENDESKD